MKGLTMALGAIALCFAGTTVYFARELHEERADHQATAAAAAAAADEQPLAAAEFPVVQASTSPAEEVSPTVPYAVKRSSGNAQPSEEEMRQMAIEESRKFLEKLSTPAGRAKALEEMKLIVRARPPGLDKFLHMDADQYSRFIDLLAQQQLASRENATRCILNKNCKYTGETADGVAARDAEIAAQFGQETVERFHWFNRSSNERQAVAELRGRLPDSARLSDAKAEELVRALVEESELISRDMERVRWGIGTSNYLAYVVMDDDPDGSRAAAAEGYNRRLRDRAAGVLTGEQLAVYTQAQNEVIEQNETFRQLRQADN
jgi:hypothetical protein